MRLPKIRRRKRPTLVVPATVVRARPARPEPSDDQFFLFGMEEPMSRTFTMRLPLDPLVASQIHHRPLRKGEDRYRVSYDMEAAHERLLGVIGEPQSQGKMT